MRREKWMVLAALPVVLLVGDFFYWRIAVSELRDGFDAWTRRAHESGWEVRHGAVVSGGWPNAATLRVEDMTIAGSGGTPATAFVSGGSDAVLLRVWLTRPTMLEIMPVRPRPLRVNNGPPVPISADRLQLRLALQQDTLPRAIDLNANGFTATLPGAGLLGVGAFSLRADLKPNAGRDQAAITFSLSAKPITLPDGMRWGLGAEVSDLALEGVVNGPLPPAEGLAARARAWRDGGGSVEIHKLSLGWGPSRIDATATLALDEELQPMGAGTGKIVGHGAALDALAANGVLTRSAATAAKALLSLLANPSADGQPEEVEVPIALQFRTLSVRQVPLARLPELDWPDW